MEKYYTPEIEEFHIGFEFEYYGDRGEDNSRWHKDILDKNFWTFVVLEDRLHNYNIPFLRVKYLDKDDIESILNIKPKLGGSFIFEKDVIFRPNWLIGVHVTGIKIWFHPENTWVKVEYLIEQTWEKFFEGTIKNKNEFIKMLKSIGLNECWDI